MTMCAVFSFPNFNQYGIGDFFKCHILINKHDGSDFYVGFCPSFVQIKSRHLWFSYIPSQMFNENKRTVLGQMDENGFIQMEVIFRRDLNQGLGIKKCGFRLVYKRDVEDIKEMISTQSSNITYVTLGLDVRHDSDNSTEGIKMKRSRDEGNSYDVPHSKRIQR